MVRKLILSIHHQVFEVVANGDCTLVCDQKVTSTSGGDSMVGNAYEMYPSVVNSLMGVSSLDGHGKTSMNVDVWGSMIDFLSVSCSIFRAAN